MAGEEFGSSGYGLSGAGVMLIGDLGGLRSLRRDLGVGFLKMSVGGCCVGVFGKIIGNSCAIGDPMAVELFGEYKSVDRIWGVLGRTVLLGEIMYVFGELITDSASVGIISLDESFCVSWLFGRFGLTINPGEILLLFDRDLTDGMLLVSRILSKGSETIMRSTQFGDDRLT